MISSSNIRFRLLISSAVAAFVSAPAAGQVIHPFPVLEATPGADGGADVPSVPFDNTLTIGLPDTQPKTIIRWDSFDIAAGNTVEFEGSYTCPCGPIFPPLAVLNRVTGSDGSDIYGALKSEPNIEVFLINPNGIIFGPGARVDVGSLIASTLDIDDDEFGDGGSLDSDEPTNPALYYFFGYNLNVEDEVSTGITVQNGAQVKTSTGPLTLLGAFIDVQAGGSVTAATDVGLVAGNSIRVPADPGSRVSFSIYRPTPTENAITIAGQVSGERVTAFMETKASAQNALLFVADTGSITATKSADGNIVLNIAARTDSGDPTNSPGGIRNNGTLSATGAVILSGSVSGGVRYPPRFVENNGTITAGDYVLMRAIQDITNSGSITAVGDVIFEAGRDILDPSASLKSSIAGADVALSAGGSVTVGTVAARDDIAIRANGTVTSTSLTSGATIGAAGPVDVAGAADDLLPGVNLSGHDVDVDGSAIAAGVIRALGTGSDIRLRAPVTASRDDLDFAAGGDITVDGSASGVDVAMDAGGTITAGDISARDDIALRAGNTLNVGTLASGITIGGGGPIDQTGSADALLGEDLAGHDLFVQGGSVSLTQASANGTNSDLTVRATTGDLSIVNGTAGGKITLVKQGTTGILTAGTLLAGTGAKLTSDTDIDAQTVQTISGDLAFTAGRDVTVHSSLAADDVAIDAGRNITTGDISARDDIALRAGNTLNVGLLASGVSIGGTGPIDSAGAADALLGQDLAGHDLFVQGGSVSLTQASANGTNSDLTVRATTGDLSIVNGTAGGTITLVKQGTTGILTAGTLLAGTGAALTSDTDIHAQRVETISGDLAFIAGRDVVVDNPLIATDVAIKAGRSITTKDITARDDIAIVAGDALNVGALTSGVTAGGSGPVDSPGAADALLGQDLAGHDISVQAAAVNLASPSANGTNSDLIVRATSGDLAIANGTAGGTIRLTKEGASGTLSAGVLSAGTGASLTSSTSISASNVQSASGDIAFDAMSGVTVGTVLAQAGNVAILADDLDILGSIGGGEVTITNRSGGNLLTVLGDAGATGAFTLTQDEVNRINAGVVSIDSLDQNLLIGNVAFGGNVGSTRLNLLGTARVDIVGEISAAGAGRTVQIGGTKGPADPNDLSTLASIIRIAPTSQAGGRIVLDGASLDLRGAKIGVGLDDGFLNSLGLVAGGSPLSAQVVQDDWVGNPNSSLYGIPGGYANPIVISAANVTVTYADYALFQNTGSRSSPSGVDTGVLSIISSGSESNGFELFGTIDQVRGRAASLLVQPQTVSMENSRVNGCLIVSGGGCTIVSDPIDVWPNITTINPADSTGGGDPLLSGADDEFALQALVSTDDDEAFSFDSLVGTNNEGLLGVLGIDDADAPKQCRPDEKDASCRTDGERK